ncbi:hypothetical protein CERSUDRAFT_92078 [Gelatoporia subvermispora B]|uniref:Uncharacterized protein n=1 Tax=Ceriporiopsis subvermispora (strain B) TaxID=914234 RepID=M2RL83_CERS8|nr:hypothetical protein CERSUDRAFT_92078 [Gelatoporia subvermispora B]
MTSRPRPTGGTKSRPLSAIYIGPASSPNLSSPPSIPDLPEPPSPTSSGGSGLPSPPASNSTGSGSTNAGSIRQRPAQRKNGASPDAFAADMPNGTRTEERSRSRAGSVVDDDDPYEHENDEDNTARFVDGRRRSLKDAPADNMTALQRVKSLTQRNRMVLDKLSSISRLSSPAPSNHSHSQSPFTPASAVSSSSAASSSRPVSTSFPRPASRAHSVFRAADPSHSGSETERESQHHSSSHSYSSDDRSSTPLSATTAPEPYAPTPIRERRISEPYSPGKSTRTREREREKTAPEPGPSRTPRKRVSMAMSVDEGYGRSHRQDDSREYERDVTTAALAAVASSRRSPTGTLGRRSRQLLPQEFRDGERHMADGKPNGEPSTPHRNRASEQASLSPRSSLNRPTQTQTSPRRSTTNRQSTVRELTRKHQTRWLSEDLTGTVDGEDESMSRPLNGHSPGRRQTLRSGSSESALAASNGRSLVGEGLRAAGIVRKRDLAEDIFTPSSSSRTIVQERAKSRLSHDAHDWDERESPEQIREPGWQTRLSEPSSGLYRTPVTQRASERNLTTSSLGRPGTSMAALHHDTIEPLTRTAPSGLRSYRSSLTLERDHTRTLSQQQDIAHRPPSADRAYIPPNDIPRSSSTLSGVAHPGLFRDSNGEHRRLLLDALGVFESHLSRLPPMGATTTSTIPELFGNAQHVVHSLDRLNGMVRAATHHALEAQIDAEVTMADADGPAPEVDLVDLWRQVGAEHRENLRVSDELVRNMTGFLLGVGKVLREATHGGQVPSRNGTGADMTGRLEPETPVTPASAFVDRMSEGRKSRETRRSWDPSQAESRNVISRLSSRERSSASASRPASSTNLVRGSGGSSSEGRSVADAALEQTPQPTRQLPPTIPKSASARRLYTPREHATPDTLPSLNTSLTPRDLSGEYEPSPTPISRHSQSAHPDHARALPPLAVAPSLPTLPSESLLRRSSTLSSMSTTASVQSERRKISSGSNLTVVPAMLKPSSVTTAITTHTVSNAPSYESTPSPLSRSNSNSTTSSRPGGVIFSRPSTISVSTLSGLQQQHEDPRKRTTSVMTPASERPSPVASRAISALLSPQSGSETERPTQRLPFSSRSRTSLERTLGEHANGVSRTPMGTGSQSQVSTLSERRERRRTITEIFGQR